MNRSIIPGRKVDSMEIPAEAAASEFQGKLAEFRFDSQTRYVR